MIGGVAGERGEYLAGDVTLELSRSTHRREKLLAAVS